MFAPKDFLDLAQTEHAALFEGLEQVWEALPKIALYLKERLRPAVHAVLEGRPHIGPQVFIGPGTRVAATATITGPAWIGANCDIRPGAYIRENVLVGDGCVVGNSCELKNAVLFNGAQVPHFSYAGDSILGAGAHLGAGAILSNLKLNGAEVVVAHEGKKISTGLRKFGAVLGDHAEVGCNAVLNPGSLIGRRSLIYPGVCWRGVLPADSIAKSAAAVQVMRRRS